MSAALLEFDEPGRTLRPGPDANPGTDAPSRIADTLRTQGIDAPASLYNEALALARDGLLGPASQRLQMLLCLDPDDADGHLLLAKIHAAQGRPVEALSKLEAAIEAGAVAPAGFRDHLEGLIRSERQRDEEHRARVAAREQGEIKALRQEARNLRSETIRLEAEVTETRHSEKLWRIAAMVAASFTLCVGIVFAAVTLFAAPVAAPVAAPTPVAPVASTAPVAPVAAAPITAAPVQPAAPIAASQAATAAVQVTPPTLHVEASSSAPTASAPAATTQLPATHTVTSGDTLYTLAGHYYGDKTQYRKIQDANKKVLKNGIALKLGMQLTIPK
jgi:tetratricopeptide (TPR) repeat protein